MSEYRPVLVYASDVEEKSSEIGFLDPRRTIFLQQDSLEEKNLENLVYKVARQPKNLLFHLQRIYACYKQGKSEHLYAALVDFLNVLGDKGQALALRIVKGAGNKLSNEQSAQLQKYMKGNVNYRLPVNGLTVLTQDLMGECHVLEKKPTAMLERDYLQLAHDFIEYSQLEEAVDVLEQGLNEAPLRQDIQVQLLELYKVTNNEIRFRNMYAAVTQNKVDLISEWEQVNNYFNERAT